MDINLAKKFLALPRPKDEVLTMAQLVKKHVKKPMDKKYLYKYTICGVWGSLAINNGKYKKDLMDFA